MSDPSADAPPEPADDRPVPGARIILVSRVGTAAFVVTSVAAVIDRDLFGLVAVAVALILFLIGCVVFLWAFGVAVNRSRTDAIGIGGLYFLPFTSLAFGVLVPMFGLAQAGLWGARYGRFDSRFDDEKPGGTAPSK